LNRKGGGKTSKNVTKGWENVQKEITEKAIRKAPGRGHTSTTTLLLAHAKKKITKTGRR